MNVPEPPDREATFAELTRIVAILRGAGGCPWDAKQTPESMVKYLREECEEVLEAIGQRDSPAVCEELGDVLYVLAMLIAIYSDQRQFSATDVFAGIIAKMVRRHPHVFGDVETTDEQALKQQWQRIKEEEKNSPRPSAA